jgi:hypothetical protein
MALRKTRAVLRTGRWLAQDVLLDLLDQKRQIGPGKAWIRRWDAVVLGIRGDMFVVRTVARQA